MVRGQENVLGTLNPQNNSRKVRPKVVGRDSRKKIEHRSKVIGIRYQLTKWINF